MKTNKKILVGGLEKSPWKILRTYEKSWMWKNICLFFVFVIFFVF